MDKWEIKKVESPTETEAKQEAVSVPAQVEAEEGKNDAEVPVIK